MQSSRRQVAGLLFAVNGQKAANPADWQNADYRTGGQTCQILLKAASKFDEIRVREGRAL
jgi:hypothetical protein